MVNAPHLTPAGLRATHDETARVLVLDGGQGLGMALKSGFTALGCTVELVSTATAALQRLERFRPDLLAVEVETTSASRLAVLELAREVAPGMAVMVAGAQRSTEACERALRAGARHFLAPPLDGDVLGDVLRDVQERRRARHDAASQPALRSGEASEPAAPEARGAVLGESESMRELAQCVALVAPTRTTVLLTGETGVGKERVAEVLHALSTRAAAPFVPVHCAALSETLLESELFGHEKGAFPGAHARRDGRLKRADGGTLFLDEIGEVSPAVQARILRVLQERRFERVGGHESIAVDVRIVAASNRDLRGLVAGGMFRADLFYRLNVMALEVPPLRARRSEIPALTRAILARLAGSAPGGARPEVTPAAMEMLCGHDWPGNVRELENALERAIVLAHGAAIDVGHLGAQLGGARAEARVRVPGATFAEIEREAILATYEACGHSVSRTAEMLGLSPRTIHYRLREYRGETGRRRKRLLPGEAGGHEDMTR